MGQKARLVEKGEVVGHVDELLFRDPDHFMAGELHKHAANWAEIAKLAPSLQQEEVLSWIGNKVSIFPYFRHFKGTFKGERYDSDQPPHRLFKNNVSCKQFGEFVRTTLLSRLKSGAISLVGKVGQVSPPHIVLPLTVEPTKPRLCHDARYLNLWMLEKPFSLDKVTDLPRYVFKDSYQTVLDDKSGYDHLLLSEESRTYFGIQWGGWFFTYNTLPFGWKISPYVYHSTGLMASNFLRSLGVPCLLYIDDRHNGQLQVSLDKGQYDTLDSIDERNLAAAKSAVFLVAFHLVRLGYFLGLSKSILIPQKMVPYLGFLIDSGSEVFRLIPEKKRKFVGLIRETLSSRYVSVKTLQRLVGKCVSFSLAVPAARLFTREMSAAISIGMRTLKPIAVQGALRDEIAHWLFLEEWDDPLPWREERHLQIELATDASQTGWGGVISTPVKQETSDYWSKDEMMLDIATREAIAVNKVLHAFKDLVKDCRVDVMIDNLAVMYAWNNQGGKGRDLNNAIKALFFTTMDLNILLHMLYVPSQENPADAPSRRLSSLDYTLTSEIWNEVQLRFGGGQGHTCDLMALDSNAMLDRLGRPVPHFTPFPSPGSIGVNLLAQDLTQFSTVMQRPYVFPPNVLVGPVLRFLQSYRQPCTVVVLDTYPRKYWWPLLQRFSRKAQKLAGAGDSQALLSPSKKGWSGESGIPADLWAFQIDFPLEF